MKNKEIMNVYNGLIYNHLMFVYILLSYRPKSKTFLPIVESLFAQGRKGIRLRSKALWHYSLAIEAWQL